MFFFISSKTGFDISVETICLKRQILFSGKNKKNLVNLLSAELAQRVVKVNSEDPIRHHILWHFMGLFCLLNLFPAEHALS